MGYFDDLHFVGADEVPTCVFDLVYEPGELVALNYIREGAIHFASVGQRRTIIQGPAAFWTLPGESHAYGNVPGSGWYQFWVTARGPRIDRMRETGLIPRKGGWQAVRRGSGFDSRFASLVEWVLRGPGTGQAEAVWLYEQLWHHLMRERQEPLPGDPLAMAIRILADSLVNDPMRRVDFHKEAKRLGVSYDHFRRRFRQILRQPPEAFRQGCRLRAAARDLERTNQTITEVAEAYGFETVYYFSRCFRKQFGVPPSAYRRLSPLRG
ncbi:MAG: AraC family transcriptional regulator [Opitutales bacterium]